MHAEMSGSFPDAVQRRQRRVEASVTVQGVAMADPDHRPEWSRIRLRRAKLCLHAGKTAVKLKERHDVLYQVNANTLLTERGYFRTRRMERWFREGLVDYVASDAHRPGDYDDFERAYRTFRGEWPADNRLKQALLMQRKEKANDGQ